MKTVLGEANCPAPFSKLEGLTGCYFAVLNQQQKASWNEAEDECQKLHPSAHLIGLNSNEVGTYILQKVLRCAKRSFLL